MIQRTGKKEVHPKALTSSGVRKVAEVLDTAEAGWFLQPLLLPQGMWIVLVWPSTKHAALLWLVTTPPCHSAVLH
jgi:hypothetical protein